MNGYFFRPKMVNYGYMLFGAHVSAAGGVWHAPANSAAIGGEIFQFFSRSPQGGPAPAITKDVVTRFRRAMAEHHQQACYIHTPYFINFASATNRIAKGSISIVRQELERGDLLGAAAIMTHLGSGRDLGQAAAVTMTVAGLLEVLTGYNGKTLLLLENAAGAGEIIGDSFVELGQIVDGILKKMPGAPLGVCLDTCHAFASGYDIRTADGVNTVVKEFDRQVGLSWLKLLHLNDSQVALGARKDRHADLGDGLIGRAGFTAVVNHPKLKHINGILETPTDSQRPKDLAWLQKVR